MSIRFGVELETRVPASARIDIGIYHCGTPVQGGYNLDGQWVSAPTFNGQPWKAERDASIQCHSGERACEFVSPILSGEEGVEALCRFVEWMNVIGAKVNASCGCHITVGIDSVIGASDPQAVSLFARKLAHVGHWHAKSLYGQTGTGRHLNHYCHAFFETVDRQMKSVVQTSSVHEKKRAADACGRGMINFMKVFNRDADGRYVGAVEFRVFAGTTSIEKILHHLATVLGMCRRAHQVQCLGGFNKNKLQAKRTASAEASLYFLWDYLGWTNGQRDAALGLFGRLHTDFGQYGKEAVRLCQKFDRQFPDAAL
jgi:hypothetical protein